MNKIFLLFCILLVCTSILAKQKPNIVLILTDDQGWGDLSINGNSNISTPNIDKLAKAGVTFERFFVCPVCSPTRAELLTGRYHVRGGVYSTSAGGERLDLDEITIAEIFKNAGYKTAAYGKWHNGMQAPYHPNARGFDDYYGFCSGHWGNYFSPMLERNGEIVKGNGFVIDDFTEKGMEFMTQNQDQPFFLYLPYNTPHSPMQVPDKWWDKFKDKEIEMRHRDAKKEDVIFTRAALAMCENIDWNVGRLLSKAEELGLSENTIFIYLSDNGPNSYRWNDGMKGKKGSTDEGGVRSPMIMMWEGTLKAGKKITEIASGIDLLPTLAELAGVKLKTKKELDGKSLKPLLMDDEVAWEDRLIFNAWKGKLSVRGQRFRLGNQNQLFDMDNDPGQMYDISAKFPNRYKKFIDAKRKWELEVVSELPDKDVRGFVIGHPDFPLTQIPARDGKGHGNLKRSSRHANCTFYTNWISVSDSLTWDVEVLEEGKFEVEIYYTCPADDVGSTFELSFGEENLSAKITVAHNPPLRGMEEDRFPRIESYVKDFKPMKIGQIYLKKGKGVLKLKASEIPGAQLMDFRLLMLKRI